MNEQYFSIYDRVAELFSAPFLDRSIETATRGFKTVCNMDDSKFAAHPTDYVLMHIGVWNAETGVIEPLAPRAVASAMEMMEPDVVGVPGAQIDEHRDMRSVS